MSVDYDTFQSKSCVIYTIVLWIYVKFHFQTNKTPSGTLFYKISRLAGEMFTFAGCQIPNKFFKERPRHYENNIGNFPAWYLFAGVQLMEHNLVLLRTPRVSLHFSRQPTWLVLLFFYVYHYV